jgi:hypothetical protein
MDTLEIEPKGTAQAVQHRGYVIDARGRRDSSNAWTARVAVTLRGRPIILETNAVPRLCATEDEAIRTALERARYLIDCREVSALEPARDRS